ncbi:MAG: hypothetical protein JNM17_09590 [Archangium sp.]|nr:hypothetical protein [Archangium sp.]
MKKLVSLFCVLSAAAFAQSKPTLIDAPLDVRVPMNAAASDKLQSEFRQLLARKSGALVPTTSNWKIAVAALKRQDCDVRDECLRQLAVNGSSLYALFASVERNAAGTELTALGRVVNQDGSLVREPIRITVSAASKTASLDALTQLVAALKLDTLPLTLTPPPAPTPAVVVAQPPPTNVEPMPLPPPPPPAEVRQPAPSGVSGARVGAFIALGLSIAAGGTSAGFGTSAASLRGSLPVDGRFTSQAQIDTQNTLNTHATIALGAGIGSGVALVAALILFAIPESPVAIAPGITRDGAFATVTWRFR